MQTIDKVVLKETKYIALWMLILSAVLQSVFLIIGKWDYTVLLGNLLSGGVSVLNFFLMALSVQKAINMDEKDAKAHMKVSATGRMLALFVVAILGAALPIFNIYAALIPLLFPRIGIAFRPLLDKRNAKKEGSDDAT